jgi:hypothetical protein
MRPKKPDQTSIAAANVKKRRVTFQTLTTDSPGRVNRAAASLRPVRISKSAFLSRFGLRMVSARPVSLLCLLLLCVISAAEEATPAFHFRSIDDKSLALFEGERPVFVYNHGVLAKPGVPADRNRSTYVHPLYGLDGEVLSDDFPPDHHHHRGLFWAWPHVGIGTAQQDLWALKGIEQRFGKWLARDARNDGATLGVENGWHVGQRKVVAEHVWLRAGPATASGRVLDVELALTPLAEPLTLRGAEGKSYGGLTLRFATNTSTVITTPLGQGREDLPITKLPWADLSGTFTGRTQPSGAAIFIGRDHPDYPPEWLTRHYGVLCVGWPGVNGRTFQPGETIRCRYRVWIHRGAPTVAQIEAEIQRWGGK